MSKTRSIIAHTGIQVLSKGLNIALGLAAFSLLTQYLGQEGFGQYTIITTFLGIFGVIADMGFSIIAIQMIAQRPEAEGKIFNTILSIRVITALIALGLAPAIVWFFPFSGIVKVGISLTFLSFFFSSLIQLFTALFQGRVAMIFPAYADAIGRIILLGGVIMAIITHQGLYAILIVTVLCNAIQCALLYFKARHLFPIRLQIDRQTSREVIHRSWPIALSIAFNLIYLKADILILSFFRPEADVGLYGASYRILEVLVTIPMMFMGITLSSFGDAWSHGDISRFKRYLQKSFDAMLILAIPLVVGTVFVAPQLMMFISGSDFAMSGNILQILIVATGMVFVSSIFGHLINIVHAQRTMVWGYAIGALVGLVGYCIFIPLFSFWGAAWMTVATEGLIMCIAFGVFYRRTHIRPTLSRIPAIMLASAVMGTIIWLVTSHIPLLLTLVLATLVYGITLFFLKGVSWDEVRLLFPVKKAHD